MVFGGSCSTSSGGGGGTGKKATTFSSTNRKQPIIMSCHVQVHTSQKHVNFYRCKKKTEGQQRYKKEGKSALPTKPGLQYSFSHFYFEELVFLKGKHK